MIQKNPVKSGKLENRNLSEENKTTRAPIIRYFCYKSWNNNIVHRKRNFGMVKKEKPRKNFNLKQKLRRTYITMRNLINPTKFSHV